MSNKSEKIKNSQDPNAKLIADDLQTVAAISAIADMEGGKLLVSNLVKDVVGTIETLGVKYKTLTLQEFVGICADMKSKLDLARVIARSKKNKEYLDGELEKILLAEEGEG